MQLLVSEWCDDSIYHLMTFYIGDLIQTLLIQVQKTKVDVDVAMAALDKLLKSNELNFAFLGT